MRNKYCKKDHHVVAKGIESSHVWKKVIIIREEVEHDIWWQIKTENCSFWYDNCTQQRALYFIEDAGAEVTEVEVKKFITNNV